MRQVTFTVRTVTPLFLAGASPEARAELRPPAFRGLMRYWYRALLGGLIGSSTGTLAKVMEAEASIFGATDRGSTFSVRVSNPSYSAQRFKKENYSRDNVSGRDYLLWSMAANGKGDRYKPDRLLFPKNTTFEVTFASKGDDTAALQHAVAAFWLLIHLGGIGSRSRRGAGSLVAAYHAEAEGDDGGMVNGLRFETPENSDDLAQQLGAGLRSVRALVQQSLKAPGSVPNMPASFDTLTKQACCIWVLWDSSRAWRTADEALRAMGGSLQAYRRTLPLQLRTVFGLPLMGVDTKSRRASPLLLRVAELQGGRFVAVAVLFKTGRKQEDYDLIARWTDGFTGKIKVAL